MQKLAQRLATAAAIDQDRADTAVNIILAFLACEAPPDAVDALFSKMEGARAAAGSASEQVASGGFGAMAAFNALTSAGLTVTEVQAVTREFVAYAKETAGDEAVGRIVAAIPGLEQFV